MNKTTLKSNIKEFFCLAQKLTDSGLFRSDKYLGDIGESICENLYELSLCTSGREEGHDATKNGKKYQIKLHNSKTRTNVYLGNPNKYNYLLLVIGPNSKLSKSDKENEFSIYKFTSNKVKKNFKNKSGYSLGKTKLPSSPDKVFKL